MIGIHTFWSKVNKRHTGNIIFNDVDILYTIHSALEWKKNVGPIHLYCDTEWYNYFESLGILSYWDYINTEIVDTIPDYVNPAIYLFFPKMYVLETLKPPFALVDYDIICNKNFQDTNYDLIYYHIEKAYYPLYPHPKFFYLDFDTLPISEFSFQGDAYNTAISIYNNQDLISDYSRIAIEMALNPNYQTISDFDRNTSRVLTLDQRLLAEVVSKYEYRSKAIINETFFPGIWDYFKKNIIDFHCEDDKIPNKIEIDKDVHHVWVEKEKFVNDYDYYLKFIDKMLAEIQQKYPDELLNIITAMKKAGNLKNVIPNCYFS